ncbi:MAG: phosphatase PAP2 family protein [Dehalococcoidia bacterium]
MSAAWAAVLGLALALSAAVALDGEPLPADLRLTRWTQDLPAFHSIARAFRWGTGTEGVLIVGGLVAITLWLTRWRLEAAALVAALVALRIMQPAIKNIVGRERPSTDLVDRRGGFSSESFPSGHMMSSFVLCAMFVAIAWRLPLPRGAQVAATAGLALVVVFNGTSSVYMGVHWPSDIVGGVLWALVIVIPAAAVVLARTRTHD